MIKRITYLLILLTCHFGQAQQLPVYSQHMFNKFLFNPAFAGTQDYYEVIANYRYQWVGITDAPRTYILSVNGPHKTKSIGIGGTIFADVVGPTSRTAVNLSYAYHLTLSPKYKLGLGLSGGLLQYRVDGQKVLLLDENDLVLTSSLESAILPDFSMGAYFYSDELCVGVSVPQFMQNRINLYDTQTQTLSKLSTHYFLNAGYRYKVNDDFTVEPTILVKYVFPVDVQYEFGAKILYQSHYWLGFNFRTQDAASVLIGLKSNNEKVFMGYAYDMAVSNLRNYSSGTHELMLAAKFGDWRGRVNKLQQKIEALEEAEEELKQEELELNSGAEEESQEEEAKEPTEEEQKQAKIDALESEDKEQREKLRALKQEAQDMGFDSPDNENFPKRQEYLDTLKRVNEIYYSLKALKN